MDEQQFKDAKQCTTLLKMLIKAHDGKMMMNKILPRARQVCEDYYSKYPENKVNLGNHE